MSIILKNDFKKALKRKYIIGFVFIAVILQGFIQLGNLKQFNHLENRKALQEAERTKVGHYRIYRQYATHGIILMFVPSSFSILFNESTFDLLVSKVNMTFIFDIDLPKKGKELFAINSPFMNFMGMSLLFIFYFCIFYGKDTTINKDYIKSLSSISGSKKTLQFIIFFRIILLNAAFLLMFVVNISVLLLNNINLFRLPLLIFCLALILVITFSFSIGCILGTIKSSFKRNAAFFVIYLFSVILFVLFLNLFTKIKAGDIKPVFEFNNENLEAVMLEEENMIKKHGVLPSNRRPTEEEIKSARQSFLNYDKKIRENLDVLKQKLKSKIKTRNLIASLFPTLFYFYLCEDASNNGYESFIDFYSFSQNRKQGFGNFCADKIYPFPLPEKPPEIESFIKDNEDLFFAKSRIPRNFWLGSIISILWIAVLLWIAIRRTLKQVKGETGETKDWDFDVTMESDGFNYFATADEGLKSQVYNFLTGDGITTVKITIDEKVLDQKDFIYVYQSGNFYKDIDKKVLYTELLGKKCPEGIEDFKTWKILVQGAEKTKSVLVFDNFFKGLKVPEVKEIIKYLQEIGVKALYIGDNLYEAEKIADNLIFSVHDLSVEGIKDVIEEIKDHR